MFKSAFAQECLEETRVSNSSTDSISAAMLPRERHKLYKSQVKTFEQYQWQWQGRKYCSFGLGARQAAIMFEFCVGRRFELKRHVA